MSDSITIDGVEIPVIAREKAVTDETMTPITSMQGKELRSVDKLLLGDGRELFLCVHPAAPDCGYTAVAIRSVTAHQRTHSGLAVAKRAKAEIDEAKARADALERELNERKQSASDRAKRAAQTRNSRRQATDDMTATVVKADRVDGDAAPTAAEFSRAIQRVQITASAMDTAVDEHHKAVFALVKLVNDNPGCDPQIIAKAKQFDLLRGMLNDDSATTVRTPRKKS